MALPSPSGALSPNTSTTLGRVRKVAPGPRLLARTLAALSGSPKYAQYEGDPPPCEGTHQTPRALPFGQTPLLSGHGLEGGTDNGPRGGK
ncbi:hypothetical protein GCM10022244_35550 [Streptomyces gulbargensis]|uniref:Uncharacterized protein n=1 Tax=Streptomyces gulbargensis TaxID=364901 RepID=A0ABP7MH21_9ACTN